MKWFEIAFTSEQIDRGEHLKLSKQIARVWEDNDRPDDFALFGTHDVKIEDGHFTVYYLTPSTPKYCLQLLTAYKPVITENKPPPEFGPLRVIAGDEKAIRLLRPDVD